MQFSTKNLFLSLMFLTIWIAIAVFAVVSVSTANANNPNRYAIVHGNNMPTILIDQKTGLTWRNVNCSDDTPVLNCWEKMVVDSADFALPDGEKPIRKIQIKILDRQQKEAEAIKKSTKK